MRRLILPLLLLCAGPALAGPLPAKGTPYDQARKALAAQGYEPFSPYSSDGGCSIGREAVCSRFHETLSCSGTGLALCRFLFVKGRNAGFVVTTYGEDDVPLFRDMKPLSKRDLLSYTSD